MCLKLKVYREHIIKISHEHNYESWGHFGFGPELLTQYVNPSQTGNVKSVRDYENASLTLQPKLGCIFFLAQFEQRSKYTKLFLYECKKVNLQNLGHNILQSVSYNRGSILLSYILVRPFPYLDQASDLGPKPSEQTMEKLNQQESTTSILGFRSTNTDPVVSSLHRVLQPDYQDAQ